MSVLSSVKGEFSNLYSLQKQLDDFSNNITSIDDYQVMKIKEEISNILANVLSLNCENVLSCSFYMQVNNIEQAIYNVLNEKKNKLSNLINCKNSVYKLATKLFSNIYSIEVIQNSAHIKLDIEKRLLDIKNSAVKIDINNKKMYALNYLKEKNSLYKDGLIEILNIVKGFVLKDEIDFDSKKKIFEAAKNISISTEVSSHHTKVFNEEQNSDGMQYAYEYVSWYENIFLTMCGMTGINLPSFSEEIITCIKNDDLNTRVIEEYANFISSKYEFEMDTLINKSNEENLKENMDINKQIGYCLFYDNIVDIKELLYKIQVEKRLPDYLLASDQVEKIKHLLFDLDIEFDENITAFRVIHDLHDKVYELFDINRYIDLYRFNSKYKSRQVAAFRQYYIDILEKAKDEIIQKYIDDIEDIVKSDTSDNCSTSEFMRKIEKLKLDIKELEDILKFINGNYRMFDEKNLKLYINTIQKRYQIDNLYNNIASNQDKLVCKLRAKAYVEQVKMCVSEFASNDDIKSKLQCELVNNIPTQEDNLKDEIIKNINRIKLND